MEKAKCHKCGRGYGDKYGFPDLIVPNSAWRKISPTKNLGGLLCPSCICEALIKKKIKCEGSFMSGNIRSVSPELMQTIRWIENLQEGWVPPQHYSTSLHKENNKKNEKRTKKGRR